MLVGMPEPNWGELRDAYGSAHDLPDILAELEPDPKSPVWTELWGRVCHQYSTYSASPYVLPFLLSAATGWQPSDRGMPLALAGCIVAARETNLEGHEAVVDQLRQVTLETLRHSNLSRADRVYLMQSALAFEGDRLWGHALDRLNDGEFRGNCPSCHIDLRLVVGEHGFFCTTSNWVRNPTAPRRPIRPTAYGELTGVGQRLHALCLEAGDQVLAEWICHLFGTSTCPQCHQSLDVATVVAAFERPWTAA
jgi:hypothetical protein